jgi:S1-C subfamily serine protease
MRALILALLLVLVAPRPASALELPELVARTKPSVVLLTIYDGAGQKLGTGTGFFVSADGRVITNHHVIRDAVKVTATLSNNRIVAVVGVLGDDAKRDIALLQAEIQDAPALPLGESKKLRAGDEVAVIGSPLGLSGTVSVGIVAALRDQGLEPSKPSPRVEPDDDEAVDPSSWGIQITAAISPGSSGSPILTLAGEVVGVAVGTRVDGQNLNFGVPIEVAKELLAGVKGPPASFPEARRAVQDGQRSVLGNLAISAAGLVGMLALYLVIARIVAWRERRALRGNRPLKKK